MHKLDLALTRLRLVLAEVAAKDEMLQAQHQATELQLYRLVSAVVHDGTSVDRTLSQMQEVDVARQDLLRQQQLLQMIRDAAQHEMESLRLTKIVDEARRRLGELRQQLALTTNTAEAHNLTTEMARLETIIRAASEEAARSIKAHHEGERPH